jgi:hypothetical protein
MKPMKTVGRIWPVLLAATFVTIMGAATTLAADGPKAATAQLTCPPAKTTAGKRLSLVPTRAKQARLATRWSGLRSQPIRLASRFYVPTFGYFPLYLGITY